MKKAGIAPAFFMVSGQAYSSTARPAVELKPAST